MSRLLDAAKKMMREVEAAEIDWHTTLAKNEIEYAALKEKFESDAKQHCIVIKLYA